MPALLIGLVMLVIYGPWVIATAWDSFFVQYGEVSSALKDGRTVDIILGLLDIGALIVPVAGGILLCAWVSKRWSVVLWRLSRGKPLLRTGIAVLALAVVTALFLTLLWLGHDLSI